MDEKIIVTMTTWKKRISNIPAVLDSIYAQTLPPDKVIINLAFDECVPDDIQSYIEKHGVEVFRVPDTKVYKKLIPTLKRYPNDLIIAIDDDWIYPEGMIADFINVHRQYPNNPISGNHAVNFGLQCHCGCASLVKAKFYGTFLDCIDSDLMQNCSSDDIVYTYFACKAGFPYIRTEGYYSVNMKPYNNQDSYSSIVVCKDGIGISFDYLVKRFGKLPNTFSSFISDSFIADLLYDIHKQDIKKSYNDGKAEGLQIVYNTLAYRAGKIIVWPFCNLKSIMEKLYKK